MKFVRNVLHDLVEKKLWPVAVALIAGAVAVPFVLGGSSDAGTTTSVASNPVPTTGAAGAGDVAPGKVVSLAQQTTGAVDRGGPVRNPFVQHHMAKTTTTALQTTSEVVGALTGNSSSSSSGGTGGSSAGTTTTTTTTPTTTTPTTGSTKKPSGSSATTYGVSFKFGEDGAEKTYKNVARLTPLPSSDNPFFVFLGLSDDGKSAVFLVSANAVPTGDGTCQPSLDDCQQVILKKGDMEFFDLQSGTAGVVQYQLEITDIHKAKATKASAAKAHARESRAGREYLREVVAQNPDALSAWSFSSATGLLVAKDASVTSDVANVPQDLAEVAAGQTTVSSATPAPNQP